MMTTGDPPAPVVHRLPGGFPEKEKTFSGKAIRRCFISL
jgi:hypothetical protein